MTKNEGRLAKLEAANEGEKAPADADVVVYLCSPKVDANGRAIDGEGA